MIITLLNIARAKANSYEFSFYKNHCLYMMDLRRESASRLFNRINDPSDRSP